MSPLAWPAPAKLNLFLHVTGRRPDGYHTLETVFQLLDYSDTLYFQPLTKQGDTHFGTGGDTHSQWDTHFSVGDTHPQWDTHFTCSDPTLATQDNLVLKAARLLQQTLPEPRGARIHLEKRIPAGGGLGGGSSDAATTLIALNKLWGAGLGLAQLAALGLKLGADVPVFIHGHSAWAEGVGEKLEPLTLPEDWFVVLTPPIQVSTARVFGHPELTRGTAPLRIRAFPFSGGKNDCESVTCMLYPEVKSALEWLGKQAAPATVPGGGAHMSGTGSSVFARFSSREQAAAVLARKPAGLAGFIARGTDVSPLHKLLF